MLSVSGYAGQVRYHTWHGVFIAMKESEHEESEHQACGSRDRAARPWVVQGIFCAHRKMERPRAEFAFGVDVSHVYDHKRRALAAYSSIFPQGRLSGAADVAGDPVAWRPESMTVRHARLAIAEPLRRRTGYD